MDTTRVFIAIPVLDPALSKLARLCSSMSSELDRVRWTPRDQMHLTIKFLGDVDNRELPKICDAFSKCCQSIAPFRVELATLGTFPKDKPPRVIWAGVSEGKDTLSEMHTSLDTELSSLGIPRETRKFTPHLTLGRVSKALDQRDVAQVMEKYGHTFSSQFEVDEVLLLSSERRHGQIAYEPIDHVEL